MARGQIQIKRRENQTNRQVTYSKRRNGIFKKAQELTVLCDAKVSIIMISSTQKLHEYISPSSTIKQLFDQYQMAVGADLWSLEKMQVLDRFTPAGPLNLSIMNEFHACISGEYK